MPNQIYFKWGDFFSERKGERETEGEGVCENLQGGSVQLSVSSLI